MDNKVSKKAIWEGAISPDNDTPSIGSQMQTQPQMMFCYKCNNVIPGNSTFCPYCQIKLFVECPKCGTKYSSQYPACNNCGTNREEYLRAQRREQERKEAIERENRRKRLEEESQKRLAKEEYNAENTEIVQTAEYKSIHLSISEAWTKCSENKKRWDKIMRNYMIATVILMIPMAFLPMILSYLALALICGILPMVFLANYMTGEKHRYDIIADHLSNKGNYFTSDIIEKISRTTNEKELPNICIIAYRKKFELPINYKWHSLK